MPENTNLPPGVTPDTQDLFASIRQAAFAELNRANMQVSNDELNALALSLMQGAPNEHAQTVLRLAHMGDSATPAPAHDEMLAPGVDAYGRYLAQRAGRPEDPGSATDIFGWTPEKVTALGRAPLPRELSLGGRQEMENRRRRDLLYSAAGGEESRANETAAADAANQYMAMPMGLGLPGAAYHLARQQLNVTPEEQAARYAADSDIKDRRFGNSGWLGAMFNPEYTAGFAMQKLNVVPEAAWMTFRDAMLEPSPQEPSQRDVVPSGVTTMLEPTPATFVPNGLTRLAGEFLDNVVNANDRTRMMQYTHGVEPTIPASHSPSQFPESARHEAARQAIERGQAQTMATGRDFDDWYRSTYGEYPSFAGRHGAMLLNGLLDPSFLVGNIPAKVTQSGARAAFSAARAAHKALPLKALTGPAARYANHIAGKTMRAGGGYLRSVLNEIGDEGAVGVPLVAGLAVGSGAPIPPVRDWLTPGNEARVDMYVPEVAQDGQVQMRPETHQEFGQRMQKKDRDYQETRNLVPMLREYARTRGAR